MSAVLVTGASGFLGSHVVHELASSGTRVVTLDQREPSDEARFLFRELGNLITYERGSVEDWTCIDRVVRDHEIHAIVHAAAIQDFEYSRVNPAHTYAVNIGGLINTLEVARLRELGRVVYIASTAVYSLPNDRALAETHPVSRPDMGCPSGHYGASKGSCELIGLTYHEQNGIDFVSVRPSSIYGLGMRLPFYVKPMVENSIDGRPARFDTGRDMLRDLVYVADVARGIRLALEAPSASLEQRAFNLASGRLASAGEIAEHVRAVVPEAQIDIGTGLTDWERQTLAVRAPVDSTAATQQLSFSSRDLGAGVADYADQYRSFSAWRTSTRDTVEV